IDLSFAELLANDSDGDGDVLTITSVSSSVGGSAVLGDGVVHFTPSPNFHGEAGFSYTISDGKSSVTAAVSFSVTSVDDAPVAIDRQATIAEDGVLVVTDLAAGSIDAEGDSVQLISARAHGSDPLPGEVEVSGGVL